MENKRNRIRGLNDILRDQLDLLAEQSELEGDGGNLAALSREMVNIYQALTISEAKGQKGDSSPNVDVVTEIVMDVVERIEKIRTEEARHTEPENKDTENICLIDITRMVRDATERRQTRQEKAVPAATETATYYPLAVQRYFENVERNDPNWIEKCRAPYLEYLAKKKG